ncbi:MAG TPA: hypothetical protein VES67_01080 [Vicinamibacterales bacterium]|nr:hypothetical protein [Vicinamibacterales bacterium]
MTLVSRFLVPSLLAGALVAGTVMDRPRPRVPRMLGGYHVLAADFHVHMFPLGWATLAPWDTVIEARYQGLDVIALTPHNLIWPARIGKWFSRVTGGPMVIVGEEIPAPDYHLLGIGLTERVSYDQPLSGAIDDVHRQGGVAIAAHPYENVWSTFQGEALKKLDAAEVVRPEAQNVERLGSQLREFFSHATLTAIGDSDYHGLGPLGYSRTYVFARSVSEQGVIDALREGRTVVYDRTRVYGDPALIQLAADAGGLPSDVPAWPTPGALSLFSRIAGLLSVAGFVLLNRWNR